jgi:hypothetical protein
LPHAAQFELMPQLRLPPPLALRLLPRLVLQLALVWCWQSTPDDLGEFVQLFYSEHASKLAIYLLEVKRKLGVQSSPA